jgi:hypothetical protein
VSAENYTENHNENYQEDQEPDFHQVVTEELYNDLVDTVEGEKVAGLALWEESLADDEGAEVSPDERDVFDMDLYLENHRYLEIFAAYVFTDPEGDALRGLDQLGKMFSRLIERGLWLDEIAVTEDDELVLILSRNQQPQLYLNVGGWTVETWETLPEED